MKKNTLILIAGAVVAYLAYMYFMKKKATSVVLPVTTGDAAILPATNTKGTMIVPNTPLSNGSAVATNDGQIIASNHSIGPPYLWMGTKNNYNSSSDACLNKASQVEYYVWAVALLNSTLYYAPTSQSVYAGDYLKWICVRDGSYNGAWKAIRVGPTGKILEVIDC